MKLICVSLYLFLLIHLVISKPRVHKCCGLDQYVGRKGGNRKLCTTNSTIMEFKDFPIFTGDKEVTDKKIFDIFNIVPGKFQKDNNFFNKSLNSLGIQIDDIYLNKNGDLYTKAKGFKTKFTVYNAQFCVDLFMNKRQKLQPAYWMMIDEPEEISSKYIFISIAMLVSCFFLFLVLLVYLLLPELRNLCGLILMAYVASLLLGLLLLAIIRIKIYSVEWCYRLTLGIYFFLLASFCWMTVMSYDIWWTFRGYAKARPIHRRGETFKFFMYCICAFGVSLTMTCFLAWVYTLEPDDKPWITRPIPNNNCFLENKGRLHYLYIPMLILIFMNWMFYLMTAFNIWRLSRGTSVLESAAAGTPAAHRTHRNRFLVYLKLSVVMGLNWVLEVISSFYPDFQGWLISDTYNILIGVLIFLIFVCKKKIYKKLMKLYMRHKKNSWHPNSSSRSNSNASSSSDTSQETQTLQVCINPKGPSSAYVVNDF